MIALDSYARECKTSARGPNKLQPERLAQSDTLSLGRGQCSGRQQAQSQWLGSDWNIPFLNVISSTMADQN